eukprot:scaffold128778_cov54-Prasinocladus_malaysianus.AAC.1
MAALKGLKSRLGEIQQYLELVESGKLPVNHDIIYELQALLYNKIQLTRSLLTESSVCYLAIVKSNDMMLVIYLSSMIRSVIALHNLIDNKETRARGNMPPAKELKKPPTASAKA